jgi:hypothetical protein
MRNRWKRLFEWAQRRRGPFTAAIVLTVSVAFSGMAVHTRRHAAEHTLVCSLRGGAHRGKPVSSSIFDPHGSGIRIDRIVSGAVQLATSL